MWGGGYWRSPVAKAVSLVSSLFQADNVQDGLEEIDFRSILKEPTGFLNLRADSVISFTNATRTFAIGPVSTNFIYYIAGRRYEKTATETVQITDTEGFWFIYYNGATLTASQTPWAFDTPVAFVAGVHWDATNKQAIIFAEERHGLVMDWATHKYLHNVDRTQIERGSFDASGYVLDGNGSLNEHATIALSNGVIYDEDIIMPVTHSATPTNPFEQYLTPLARIPIYYRSGSSASPVWRKLTATDYPVAANSPNTCRYNRLNAGTWSLQNATNGYYLTTWVAATDNIFEPIIAILGDNEQPTIIGALKYNVLSQVDFPNLPFVKETKFLYRLTFQTSTTFTNAPKAVLRSIASDVRDEVQPGDGVTPPFVFSKDGNTTVGTYLRTGSVQTSRTGQIIKGNNYAVEIHISHQSNAGSTTRVQFQRRTAVGTRSDITDFYIDLPSGQYRGVRSGIQIPVGPDEELCCYVKSGSTLHDPVAIVYFVPQ